MTILIKGMEMPQNCFECGVEWCERWKGLIIAEMSIAKARPFDCPLVEVSTPHGRLIDADEFHQQAGLTDYNELYMDLDEFKALPTVIEAEK